jgi:hypothetical protein
MLRQSKLATVIEYASSPFFLIGMFTGRTSGVLLGAFIAVAIGMLVTAFFIGRLRPYSASGAAYKVQPGVQADRP